MAESKESILEDILRFGEGYPETVFTIPSGCQHAYSEEKDEKLVKVGFTSQYGVINEYVSEDGKSFKINKIVFPDGFEIDVDTLLEGK